MTIRNRRRKAAPLVVVLIVAGTLVSSPARAARSCFGRPATKVGTRGSDYVRGTQGRDVIVGLRGSDTIEGLGGRDLVCSGRGADTLVGGPGNDRLHGGRGADDFLIGQGGNDTLRTGAGAQNFAWGGPGDDRFIGGGGIDYAIYLDSVRAVDVNLSIGSATGEGTDSLIGFEGVTGSDHDDTLTGGPGTNILVGGAGADTIDSGGNSGSLEQPRTETFDFLVGDGDPEGTGYDDTLIGGPGLNIVDYSSSPVAIEADLKRGLATGEGVDTLTDVQAIVGSAFDDILIGDQRDNAFRPGRGNDTIDGDVGEDVVSFTNAFGVTASLETGTSTGEGTDSLTAIESLWGSSGGDTLAGDGDDNSIFAFGGADQITGSDGDDLLNGGRGTDTIDGGAGNDTCRSGETIINCEGSAPYGGLNLFSLSALNTTLTEERAMAAAAIMGSRYPKTAAGIAITL